MNVSQFNPLNNICDYSKYTAQNNKYIEKYMRIVL